MRRTPVCPPRKGFVVFIILSLFLILVSATSTVSQAQVRNRITRNLAGGESAVVMEAHPLAASELDQGRVNGSMRIEQAAIVFKLAPSQQAALEKLLAEQQDPDSPNFQKWLSPEQYAARFGISSDDLAKVSAWLQGQGLTVKGYSRARTRIFFSGTAAQVENVFHTELHQYQVNGGLRFANATEVSVPAALSSLMLGVRGLDNFRPQPRARLAKPNFTSHQTGNHFVAPGDFATIYNLKPLYAAGLDGTGEKIAVVGQTQINVADVDAFRAAAGLPATNLQFVSVDGTTGTSTGDEVEADLDVEWAGGVAKNATVLFVYVGSNSPNNVFNALEYAIDNKLAPVISTSYGNCEAALGTFTLMLQQEAQQANSQGQTITAASGDSGAADCEASSATTAIKGYAVDAPASVPEVTGIGGSEFTLDSAGAVSGTAPNTTAAVDPPYWSGSTGTADTISSALIYIPETGWNDTTVSIAAMGGLSASGGGVSTKFLKPVWQNALTPADNQRDVPDVTLSASPFHDSTLICSEGSCVSGFRASDGSLNVVGGTSVGAPSFAGIVAILNQATPAGGLGNINPTLYSLAVSKPTAFHDITSGDNIVPCTAGTPTTGAASARCPSTGPAQIGFKAGTGYDLVTGLGSIDANLLVTSWPTFDATPDFSIGGSPVTISGPGQSGTSTVTVSAKNGFAGTVNLTCVPATLPAGVTCAFAPASVTPGSSVSATSTLTFTTTSTTPAGTTNIGVTGTSGSVTHNASVSLTVAAPNFTVNAPALSPATVAPGSSATSTITVASTGGYAGAVALACTSISGGSPPPTCAFSLSSVANSSGTSVLTVSTAASHSISSAIRPWSSGFGWMMASSSALLAGVFFLGVPERRRRRMAGLGLMLFVFLAAGLGCGGGSSSNGGSTQTGGTPAGTYNITVTATSGSLPPQLISFTLVVN
jgi:subtilase family serine protease